MTKLPIVSRLRRFTAGLVACAFFNMALAHAEGKENAQADLKGKNINALQHPEDCDRVMEQAILAGDLDAAAALYTKNAVFVVDDDKLLSGPALRENLKSSMKMQNFHFKKLKSYINEDAGIALLIGEWYGVLPDEGGSLQKMTGRNIEVVQRQADGTWRFVIDHPTGANP